MTANDLDKWIAEQMLSYSRRMTENLYTFGTTEPRVIRRQGIQQRWDIPTGDEIRIDDKQTLIVPRK